MSYDITKLTFLDDPSTYHGETGAVVARVPAGISSPEELINFLKEKLALPAYCGDNWHALYDVLCYWDDWETTPQRVVISHQDLPFLHAYRNGWHDLQIYAEVLIDSIATVEERYPRTNAAGPRELVAIFPSQMAEELQAVLVRPPAWRATVYCLEAYITSELDPTWDMIQQYLKSLDGLTAESCTLARDGVGTVSVQYQKRDGSYYVEYQSPDYTVEMMASLEDHPSWPATIPFDLASHILETFFTHEERSPSVQWSVLSSATEVERSRWYYRNAEELLLESTGGASVEAIRQGLVEAAHSKKPVFSLEYWREVLTQPNAPLSQRLAALCLLGFSDLPDVPALLRPFLHSSIKQERWVSARFCAVWHDEEALPILLSMLTDELPLKKDEEEYNPWYDNWRVYAPRLLRQWPTPEVGERLRQALALWVRSEPAFDPEFDVWLGYENALCYELGYRDDLSALADLPLEGEHRKELQEQLEKGVYARKEQMTAQEEYLYLIYRQKPER